MTSASGTELCRTRSRTARRSARCFGAPKRVAAPAARTMTLNSATALQTLPQTVHVRDVGQRLAARGATGTLDRTRPGVVRGEGEIRRGEPVEHQPQVHGPGEKAG